ncbi:MAG: cytosolic protein [Anaerolineae bacterium]|nr:cytosolic protein [Anaerolineae bacterium]
MPIVSKLDLDKVTVFVNQNIDTFHAKRLKRIQDIRLKDILARKNPYLFRAKNINFAPDLVTSILEAVLSASEEGLFGNFLEELAIFINHMEFAGQKSSSRGIDLDFMRDETRYIVGIKSGPNWGNSSQYNAMRTDFKNALKVLRQSQQAGHIRAVLGICYGKSKPVDNGEYLRVEGQAFWEFISGSPNLYIDLIQPLGYEAKEHNEVYLSARELAFNRLTRELLLEFCNEAGEINWTKLLQFNSGNLP